MFELKGLNPSQLTAAKKIDGPVMVLAGAGSGKTRVITYRIANMIQNHRIKPSEIMSITFTRKAANEMMERVEALLPIKNLRKQLFIGTFHSVCIRIIRSNIAHTKYQSNIVIYDEDDVKEVFRDILDEMQIPKKDFPYAKKRGIISYCKMHDLTPHKAMETGVLDEETADIYNRYQEVLFENNALDFDDIMLTTYHLLKDCPDVLNHYHQTVKYFLIDEYQDTDDMQFKIINMLASAYKNICVVGDDDQSIYSFRGANVKNMTEFQYTYPDVEIIRLEQNYRSTGNIVTAANKVIENNIIRNEKTLFTESEIGSKIHYDEYLDIIDEAKHVAMNIKRDIECGCRYSDNTILYRTNRQAGPLEKALVELGIPCKVHGKHSFYTKKEIKDFTAYLRVFINPNDDVSLKRIINVPKRKIGVTTIKLISNYASQNMISFYEALRSDVAGVKPAQRESIKELCLVIAELHSLVDTLPCMDLISKFLENVPYLTYLEDDFEETRLENAETYIKRAENFVVEHPETRVMDFLMDIAMLDMVDEKRDEVQLMTIHGAKGLEFNNVYFVSVNEGVIPYTLCMTTEREIEEERRLCYVALTRAKNNLFLSLTKSSMEGEKRRPSRFLYDIPREIFNADVPLVSDEDKLRYYTARNILKACNKVVVENKLEDLELVDEADYTCPNCGNIFHLCRENGVWAINCECGESYLFTTEEARDINYNPYGDDEVELYNDLDLDEEYYIELEVSAAEEAKMKGTTEECIEGIRSFYQKESPQINDYMKLRTGGYDILSGRYYTDMMHDFTEHELEVLKTSLPDQRAQEQAMRWVYRGLLLKDAILKMQYSVQYIK